MIPYSCAQCSTRWHPGFFGNKECPRCEPALRGLPRRVLRFLRNWLLIFAAVFAALAVASYGRLKNLEQVELFGIRLVSFPNFFLIGPADYLNSLSDPGVLPGYYTFLQAESGYPSPIAGPASAAAPAPIAIPAGRPFHLIEVRRSGGREWLGGSAYMGDKPVEFWVPLEGASESMIARFDYERAVAAQRNAFFAALQQEQIPLQPVKGQGAAVEFTREHPDQTRLAETLDDSSFIYYPKSKESAVRSLHDYFLGPQGLGMTVLQMEPGFQRTPLEPAGGTVPEKSNG